MRRTAPVARWLRWLYAVLAIASAGLAVAHLARAEYGPAALNAALAVLWTVLLLRLRGR
jgi:hypothetical protein